MTRLLDAIFGVDPRALAAMRVGLAGLTLVDLALRTGDLSAFYTDAGVLPRELARALAAPGTVSIYFLAPGSSASVCIGLAVHALAAFAMLLGLRTRLATIVTWVFAVSLHGRNPLVSQGADDLLRALLFWSVFLPLGARWSLDAWRSRASVPRRVCSVATAGLMIQVAAMYAVTALHKTGAEWRDGSAVWVVLAHDHFGRPWAQALLLPHSELLRVLCRAVLWVERLAPILLLAPVLTRPARLTALVALVVLQVGFGTMLHVAHFPWVSTVALLPFLPIPPTDEATGAGPRRGRCATLAGAGFAGAALAYSLAWSALGVIRGPDSPLGRASAVGVALGLDATWTMFAPEPARDSGWFVMPGRLSDGSTIDLFPALARFDVERPVTYEKPPGVFESFPGARWLDYLMELTVRDRADLWSALSAWTCRGWNDAHGSERRLERLEITLVLEEVRDPGAPRPLERRQFLRDECR
jgi:vitamin K-dependent gamma-carboxylase-like protein